MSDDLQKLVIGAKTTSIFVGFILWARERLLIFSCNQLNDSLKWTQALFANFFTV